VRIFDRYLADIGREPLLMPEEEVALAARARAGDSAARRRLATANLRFVVSVARRYQGHGVPICDLVNEGNLGLLRAADRFDETRGVRFVSYAHWWVRRAIVEAIERHAGRGHDSCVPARSVSLDDPLGSGSTCTLEDVLPDPRVPAPDAKMSSEALRGALEAVLTDIPGREADAVRRYYGFGGGAAESLDEIGRFLGVSRERARQLKDRGLSRLRAHAARHDLTVFRRPSDSRFDGVLSGQTSD